MNGPRVVQRMYSEDGSSYTCWCPYCGRYMKHMQLGVDEGTDAEFAAHLAEVKGLPPLPPTR